MGQYYRISNNQTGLEFERTDLEEKLRTNSSNSPISPSLDIFKKKKPKKKYYGPGKNKNLKQGAQPGHKGKGRELLPPEEVDSTVICLPEPTCECGGHLKANAENQAPSAIRTLSNRILFKFSGKLAFGKTCILHCPVDTVKGTRK